MVRKSIWLCTDLPMEGYFRNWCRPKAYTQVAFTYPGIPVREKPLSSIGFGV